MIYSTLLGIAVGLSMDAFAVSIANGAVTRQVHPAFALKLAACFGLFQAAMPMLGWVVGKAGQTIIQSIDHWIALILLSFIGIQMLRDARHGECTPDGLQDDIPPKTLLALAVATSIDALATGILLPSAVHADTVPLLLLAVSIIGAITFILCTLGVFIGKKFGSLFTARVQSLGGVLLIGIGVKIFLEHVWRP